MTRLEKILIGLTLVSAASPAIAGPAQQVPAPIAGVGVGAVLLVGMGYRALKSRINR